jgi:hypothetical protein
MWLKKFWTKLFAKKNKPDEIALHISGATVRHESPFDSIEVPRNKNELTQEFIEKCGVPYFMNGLPISDDATVKIFANTAKQINIDIATKLLGDFDWRTRITGALLAAINKYSDLEDLIGKLLLKSEVCYAGSGYCLALATFGSEKSKGYLTSYLNYYLDRKDLWFDQADAFCALEYLDKDSATNLISKWNSFVSDKEHWNLERSRKYFSECMLTLQKIRQA